MRHNPRRVPQAYFAPSSDIDLIRCRSCRHPVTTAYQQTLKDVFAQVALAATATEAKQDSRAAATPTPRVETESARRRAETEVNTVLSKQLADQVIASALASIPSARRGATPDSTAAESI